MTPDPTLIIQMQRMGDLILSFPLIAWLHALEPQHPIWIVAEPKFFQELLSLAPHVVFFPPEAAPRLATRRYHRVINLSHRNAARRLAGSLSANTHLGGLMRDEEIHIYGDWHLYRASIVHNNRHNRLHWADLAALDCVGGRGLPHTLWPEPQPIHNGRRIGLFVGASEAAKRPGAAFWGQLGARLIRRGMSPFFLGGSEEQPLAQAAAEQAGVPKANLAGLFSLENFADFVRQLDLLVTPDTGPMHLGAWVQVQTLNLSMGPVNPWETAPAPPGHFVLRAEPSCTGCWHCTRHAGNAVSPNTQEAQGTQVTPPTPPCHAAFEPERVASLIMAIVHGHADRMRLPRLRVWQTARDARGLFELHPLDQHPLRLRDLRGLFWREAFLALLGHPKPQLASMIARLRQEDPRSLALIVRHMTTLSRKLARRFPDNTLWLSVPPLVRPFSGYIHMHVENNNSRPLAYEQALGMTRRLLDFLA